MAQQIFTQKSDGTRHFSADALIYQNKKATKASVAVFFFLSNKRVEFTLHQVEKII
jgi:hypothetical protein